MHLHRAAGAAGSSASGGQATTGDGYPRAESDGDEHVSLVGRVFDEGS